MKNKSKLVSIILNCYNGSSFLKEALTSIKNQTYKNWEVIFWDNQSSDNSKDILKSFRNKKFRYFLSKKHTSLYAARNLAIRKAKGKYISFLDCDDTWEKNKLERQLKLFEDKRVAVVYGNSWLKNEKSKKYKKFINYRMKEGYIYNELLQNYNVGILTAVIKKDFLPKKIEIFNSKYNIIGDFDLFIKISKKYKFRVIQDPVATYRIHENNLSTVRKNTEIKELEHWLKKNKVKLKKTNYNSIKNRLIISKYINLKLTGNFLNTLLFFLKSKNLDNSLKNFFILLLPKIVLKKIMWFY